MDERSDGDLDARIASLLPRCSFAGADRPIVCAVSGGADSLGLLVLAAAAHDDVTAIHVDHGLRQGGETESELVRSAAAGLGVAFRSVRVAVEPGPNLEARARQARFAALPADVCTGHTADDQAETVLLNVLRGAGLDGLAAMRADHRHPILRLRRAEVRALCAAAGLRPVEDPTNLDPAYRRNRVRHEVLPLLADVAGRDPVPLLARLADHSREASDELIREAGDLDPTDAAALAAAPRALARIAVRRWLRTCSEERHPPDAATVDRVLAIARLESVATDVGGGWRVARTAGRLRIEPPAGNPPASGTA